MADAAKKPSDPSSAENWVNEIVARDEESKARQKAANAPRKQRSWLPVLIPLTAACVALSIWNPGRREPEPPKLTVTERQATTALGLEIAIEAVEAYRDSTGKLPASLGDAFPFPLNVEFKQLSNGIYTLSAGTGSKRVTYRSNGPRPGMDAIVVPVAEELLK